MKFLSVLAGISIAILVAVVWIRAGEDSNPDAIGASPEVVSPSAALNFPSDSNLSSQTEPDSKKKNRESAQFNVSNTNTVQRDDAIDIPGHPTLEMRLSEMARRRNGQTFDPDEVMEAVKEPAAWQIESTAGDKLLLSEEEMKDGREFIRFKRLKLETLVEGDTLELPIAQTGSVYRARITKTRSNSDGSVTWYGTLVNGAAPVVREDGSAYDVSFTSGKRVVSGGMFTPEGHFVLETVEDQGWIATSQTLFKQDEKEPCVLVPPGHVPPANDP
jgi:hypothetical protein